MNITIPQEMKLVEGAPLATDAAGRSADIVSLKNAGKVTVIVSLTQGNAAVVPLTLMQAQDVAGTGAKALANAVPIWSNLDTAASDTLVRRADGVAYTTDAGVKNKIVVFEVDASQLDVNNGFDCLYVITGASNVANLTGVLYLLHGYRFQGSTPPSALVD